MAQFLRQSTASQEIQLGPFVDDTDGKTAETGLTISNTDIKLFKHGATSQANKNSGGGTHMANGYYSAVLDATDTDTVGNLEVTVNEAGALPVRREYVVLEEAVYDALFAASAPGYVANAPVNVAQFGGSNGTFSGGRPEVNTTLIEGSDATNQIRDSVVDDATRIDASALNSASATAIPAIQTKTDQLAFGATNVVNANITHVNEIEVTGDGETATPWNPI